MAVSLYHQLPSVSVLLEHPGLASERARRPHGEVVSAIRAVLDATRTVIARGETVSLESTHLVDAVLIRLQAAGRSLLRRVINATGIVLHTNLGRSPFAEAAAQAALEAATQYCSLELSLATGERSSRQEVLRDHLRALTGAEAATAVNNCAAATVLTLKALAAGQEVLVSRGELIEIGGSFRLPDIMAASGARLCEVGTTNRTRLSDYERAITPDTALILRVHPSNYRIRGFTESVPIEALAALGRSRGIPVVDDVGSGATFDLSPYGLPDEPCVAEGIRAGADLVLFSGDKLLGGPQAGLIAGRADLIRRIETDPLMRAFRLDKVTLAALEATLKLHRDPATARAAIPTLRMLTTPYSELRSRALALAAMLAELDGIERVDVRDTTAFAGGGSLPDVALPSAVVAVRTRSIRIPTFAERLRDGVPAVVGRIHDDHFFIDLRTVFADQEAELVEAIDAATREPAKRSHGTNGT